MRLFKVLALLGCLGMVGIAGCGGGGNEGVQADKTQQLQGILDLRAQAFSNSFAYFNLNYPTPIGSVDKKTTPEVKDTPTEENPAAQTLVTGKVSKESGMATSVTLEAHEADTTLPIASTTLSSPGFFSLVIPHHGKEISLMAIAIDGQSAQVKLGVLSHRVDDVELKLAH